MKHLVLWLALLLPSGGQEMSMESLKPGLAAGAAAFDPLTLAADGTPAAFAIKLGETPVKIGDDLYDGIRLRCPADLPVDADFVWYFNAPENWGNWYIVPVEEDPGPAFLSWLEGDKYYETFDRPGESGRVRVLQSLDGSYFTAGKDYLLWFRKSGEGPDVSLRGSAAFAKRDAGWDHDTIEKALHLKPAAPEIQVAALGSRGGRILVDRELFDPAFALGRIDAVFSLVRTARKRKHGQIFAVPDDGPPCPDGPALADIVRKHGEPDFVRSSAEIERVARHSGRDVPAGPGWIRYHYDHFAFEAGAPDAGSRVTRVIAFAADFSVLRPSSAGSSFATLEPEHLTVFSKDGKEAGRAYHFREESREPFFILEPPPGEYRSGDERLIAGEDGGWRWDTLYPDGKVEQSLPMKDHRVHGRAQGFYEDGKTRFTAEYRDGVLEGEVARFDEEGKEVSRTVFKNGAAVDTP